MSNKELTGIFVDIIGRDCTNNGVTSGEINAFLVLEKGVSYDEEHLKEHHFPILRLVSGFGSRKLMAVQYHSANEHRFMFGGHFIYTSDSRFPSDQPIHVHDRME